MAEINEMTAPALRAEIDAMKEAVKLLQANADKSPTIAVVDQNLRGFKELVDEQFKSAEVLNNERFTGIATRITDSRMSDALNIKTALDAQKDSAAKTEANFTKLFDSITRQQDQNKDAMVASVNDLKERMGLREGQTKGQDATWAYVVALGSFLGGLVMVGIAVLKLT